MADKQTLNNGLTEIQAGQTVERFLNDINENFNKVQIAIAGAPKTITFSTESPTGGQHGDIWIQYEE